MGDTIAGRFELDQLIAQGSSGSVWRAMDHKTGRECAAKVLRQRDSADLLRFVREQSVKLDHPHVVAPYGWAAEDEYVAIVMELVTGGTLEAALADNGPVSSDTAAELLWQLLQALDYVHGRGWVHRDVKPANVLLEPTGSSRPVARLADFGIAVRDSDARLTQLGVVVGTPGYLPPEAYLPTQPSAAFDLYAAGVTAVRLVAPHIDLNVSLTPHHVQGLLPDGPLANHVRGLLDTDPMVRISAARRALAELARDAPRRASLPASTAHGEPFEVFDVLETECDTETDTAAPRPPHEPKKDTATYWAHPTKSMRAHAEQREQRGRVRPWIVAIVAVMLSGLTLVWAVISGILNPASPQPSPRPEHSTPGTSEPSEPGATPQTSVSVSPKCSQMPDGSWSCVVTQQ